MLKDIRVQLTLAFLGALTFESTKSELKDFSEDARWLIENWRSLLHTFWYPIIKLIGFSITQEQATALSLILLYAGLFIFPVLDKQPLRTLKAFARSTATNMDSFVFISFFALSIAVAAGFLLYDLHFNFHVNDEVFYGLSYSTILAVLIHQAGDLSWRI